MKPDHYTAPAAIKSILDTLSIDPLAEAEKMTGKSYKEDRDTESLGLLLHVGHTKRKNEILQEAGDTHWGVTPSQVIAMLLKDGFNLLLTLPFEGVNVWQGVKHPSYDERFHILFCPRRGILARMETYARGTTNNSAGSTEGSVNGLNFYYNWRPKSSDSEDPDHSGGGSSHGVIDPAPLFKEEATEYNPEGHSYAQIGSFDGREGAFTQLAHMEQNGQFITPWLEQPFLWLLTYMDTKDKETGNSLPSYGSGTYDHKAINAERLALLPAEVRKAVLAG